MPKAKLRGVFVLALLLTVAVVSTPSLAQEDQPYLSLFLFASSWQTESDQPDFVPAADLVPDSVVDELDLLELIAQWPNVDLQPAPGVTIRPVPQMVTITNESSFDVEVWIDDAENLGAFEFDLIYNPAVYTVNDITAGDFLTSTGRTAFTVPPSIDNNAGRAAFASATLGVDIPGPDGSGVLAVVEIIPQNAGNSIFNLTQVQVLDIFGFAAQPIDRVIDGQVEVE